MMIKINYKPTYSFTSLDIFDYADTDPITYEAHARQSPEWAALCRDWVRDGAEDVSRALEIVGLAFVSVSQDGQRYPLDGLNGAEALRAAVEADNPGYGDQFIKHLALAHYNYHFRRLDDLAGNSAGPSARSADGKRRSKSNGATAKSGP